MCEKQNQRRKTGYHTSASLEEKFFASCQTSQGTSQFKRTNGKTKKKHHARLPAQVPASSVSRSPGGNNRQERLNAVSGREAGNIEQTTAKANMGTRRNKKNRTVFRNVWRQKGNGASGVLSTLLHRTLGKTDVEASVNNA